LRTILNKYVIINRETFNFLGEPGEEETQIEYAPKYNSIEEALDEINKCDKPFKFEVRELTIILDLNKSVSD
jgi:diphthamide synthase (EF-2-diphthine--ammonia ligase)